MKMNLKNLPAIFLLAAAIPTLISCKKDSSTPSSAADNNSAAANMTANAVTADNIYSDAFSVALQTSSDHSLDIMMQRAGRSADSPQGIEGTFYCANISVSGSTFPVTLTVDFGTGCKSADSITRSGSINYVFSGRLGTPGTTISAAFNNYVVNGYQLNGTYTIANTTTNPNSPQLTTTVTGGNIVFPTDTSYSFAGTKTISLASGSILNVSSLVFNVTGNYKIGSSYGDTLAVTVTTPLEKKVTCQYVDQGIISFDYTKNTDSVSGTLNYGSGTCDDQALLTIGSFTENITIR